MGYSTLSPAFTGSSVAYDQHKSSVNTPPTVDAGPDRTIEYADTTGEDCQAIITAVAADADAHYLSFEWRDRLAN